MDSSTRSRSYRAKVTCCWTCKLRHVKCDETTPSCLECTTRHVHCHGYGPRPSWMDGGQQERDERRRIKAAVMKNFKEQKALRNESLRARTPTQQRQNNSLGSAQRPSSGRPNSPLHGSPTSAASDTQCGGCDGDHPGYLSDTALPPSHHSQGNSSFQGNLSSPSAFPQPLPYEESSLLMHYLDHVFPLQYPYYHVKTAQGRGWLLWLLSKNGSLCRASLSLASLHQRFIWAEGKTPNVELEYLTRGLRELQDFIGQSATNELGARDEVLVEVVACGTALVTFEVLQGSTNGWQPHLCAMTSILTSMNHGQFSRNPMANPSSADHVHVPELPVRRDAGIDAALAFHIQVLLWMDILACVSTREKPKLPYETWLSGKDNFDLMDLMGCHNWAMKAIGDLANLDHWRRSALAAGTLDIIEFGVKSRQIEDELEDGLAFEMEGPTEDNRGVTRIFATAALVQLYLLGADVFPSRSPKLLQRSVSRVVSEIQMAGNSLSARHIPWPICVAGCIARSKQRAFFESIVLDVLAEADGKVGNCKTVLDIMRNCWKYQDQQPDVEWECSAAMQAMGICALLI